MTTINNLSSFFYRHNIGHVFETQPSSIQEALELSGLNWVAEKRKVYDVDGEQILGCYAIQKQSETSKQTLGIVGQKYSILQNIEAFSVFEGLFNEGSLSYEVAGQTGEGRRVWILARLRGENSPVTDKDEVGKYVVLSNSHDGSSTVKIYISPFRFVCSNALARSYYESGKTNDGFSISHTKNVLKRIEQARDSLGAIKREYENLERKWAKMAELKLPKETIFSYVKSVFPDAEDAKNTKRKQILRTHIHHNLQSGRGSDLGLQNTLWGAYNAITEYVTHEMSNRKGATSDKHFDSLIFGQRQSILSKAMLEAENILKNS
jgi:phage/plasmid-like protein (TIGR03299 family)